VANPGGKKLLAREGRWIHAGKFAKQIELAFSYDVNWVRDREVITDVFILDLIFCNVVHVDSDDSANGGVVEGRYSSAEFHIECPRFSAVIPARQVYDSSCVDISLVAGTMQLTSFP
jgi:hypothetical protein